MIELTEEKKRVFHTIKKGYENKLNIKYIAKMTNLSPREVVYIIAELREFVPICSTTSDGGGVWIADNNKDIQDFINKTEKLMKAHKLAISYMERHLK